MDPPDGGVALVSRAVRGRGAAAARRAAGGLGLLLDNAQATHGSAAAAGSIDECVSVVTVNHSATPSAGCPASNNTRCVADSSLQADGGSTAESMTGSARSTPPVSHSK